MQTIKDKILYRVVSCCRVERNVAGLEVLQDLNFLVCHAKMVTNDERHGRARECKEPKPERVWKPACLGPFRLQGDLPGRVKEW